MNPIIVSYVIRFLKWIKGSFDISDVGASAKKLTVFAFVFLVFYLHFNYCDISNVVEFLLIDATMIGALLGVATFDKLQQRKSEKENPNNNQDGNF